MNSVTKSTNLAWYDAYCSAMLETDADRVLVGVEYARRAIQDRAQELGSTSCSEGRELDRAMYFLSLLLRCAEPDQSGMSVVFTHRAFTPATRHASPGR